MTDLEIALSAARAAAAVVRPAFGTAQSVDYKDDDSPVTSVDRMAERALLGALAAECPHDAIVAEESGVSGPDGGRRWFIDPLDGTVNFLAGIPQVAVSVALYDGPQPLVGVVLDVMTGEEFTAEKGNGTQLNGAPISVSQRGDFEKAVVATGFGYDHREHAVEYTNVLAEVLKHVQGIRRFGSAALDLAWVAAGRFDGFFELVLAPWDIAAGLLLVTEAGGVATDWQGVGAGPGTRTLIATNGLIHDQLSAAVATQLPTRLKDSD